MVGRSFIPRAARYALVVAFNLSGLAGHAFAASLSAQDLQVLGTALAFMQPRPANDGTLAIVYATGDRASLEDARAIMAAIGSGLIAARTTLVPKLVDADTLAATDFSVAIVAAGANSEIVMRAVRAQHALCVTADQAAVQQGVCTMAIRSSERVEIVLNHQVAERTGINFATAFRMMVHEL